MKDKVFHQKNAGTSTRRTARGIGLVGPGFPAPVRPLAGWAYIAAFVVMALVDIDLELPIGFDILMEGFGATRRLGR